MVNCSCSVNLTESIRQTLDEGSFGCGQSLKSLNKLTNRDIKHLNNWLNANKISLNEEKTELVFFKSPRKVLPDEIKTKLSGRRLDP